MKIEKVENRGIKMRKKNGFMLVETLIVSVFVGVTLVILFIQLQNISNSYERTFAYNTANNLYNAKNIKKYLALRNFDKFTADVRSTVRGYIDITSCDNPNYVAPGETPAFAKSYCEMFYKNLRIKKILLTFEDLTDIKHILTKNAESDGLSQKLVDFVDYIQYDKNPDKYRLIIEFEDDTYASIQMSSSPLDNAVTVKLDGNVASGRCTQAEAVNLQASVETSMSDIGPVNYRWQIKSGDGYVDTSECTGTTCLAKRTGETRYRVVVESSTLGEAYSNSFIVNKKPTC